MMCPGAENLKNVCCIRKLEMNVIFVKSDSIIVAIVILFILQLQKHAILYKYNINPYLTMYVSYFYDKANGSYMEIPKILALSGSITLELP